MRASVRAVDLAQHELAILHARSHGAGLNGSPGLRAGHVGAVSLAPARPGRLDRLVRVLVQLAGAVLRLRLQHHALRPDDVLPAHADERLRIIVVRRLFARSRHQHALVLADQLVCGHGMRQPVAGRPVALCAVEHAHDATHGRKMAPGWRGRLLGILAALEAPEKCVAEKAHSGLFESDADGLVEQAAGLQRIGAAKLGPVAVAQVQQLRNGRPPQFAVVDGVTLLVDRGPLLDYGLD